ncbi:MAG: hypothetical protein ACLQDQ_05475 [Myxococcaceae bacterium]
MSRVLAVLVTLVGSQALAQSAPVNPNTVQVRGYEKKDGTYVAPHTQTAPNATKADNYSTKGNVNPYTGKKGTKNP